MDIFRNLYLVNKAAKSKNKTRLYSNGDAMVVSHQATLNGYHKSVRFSENMITNIIALRNLSLQYLVTYNNDEIMFIVHIESEDKPSM